MNLLNNKTTLSHIVLDSTQTRQIEKVFLDKYGDFELMKMAATAMYNKILKRLSNEDKILIWTGSGNNGGDGFIIGSLLLKAGYTVGVIEVLPPKASKTVSIAKNLYLNEGGKCTNFSDVFKEDLHLVDDLCKECSKDKQVTKNRINTSNKSKNVKKNIVIIDAITGIGFPEPTKVRTDSLSYQIMAKAVTIINLLKLDKEKILLVKSLGLNNKVQEFEEFLGCEWIFKSIGKVREIISIDIPSLLNADIGQAPFDLAVKSDLTLTVFTLKNGLYLGHAKEFVKKVKLVLNDLDGLDELIFSSDELLKSYVLDYKIIKSLLPIRSEVAHKGSVGKLLAVGGNKDMTGALVIASLGSLYTGIGLVCALPLSKNTDVFNIKAPEILTASIDSLDKRLKWANVYLIGPGLGQTEDAKLIFKKVISFVTKNANLKQGLVIDADGLLALKSIKKKYFGENVVITPHLKEAADLLDITVDEFNSKPCSYAHKISKKYSVVCVIKSSTTIIVEPKGKTFIIPTGTSGMASGGMGDLLSGIISSLLGQGFSALESAIIGVLIHGQAGKFNALKYGNIGLHATTMLDDIRLLINGRGK